MPNNNMFDPDEAMEAAVDKRKFLLKRLLDQYNGWNFHPTNKMHRFASWWGKMCKTAAWPVAKNKGQKAQILHDFQPG